MFMVDTIDDCYDCGKAKSTRIPAGGGFVIGHSFHNLYIGGWHKTLEEAVKAAKQIWEDGRKSLIDYGSDHLTIEEYKYNKLRRFWCYDGSPNGYGLGKVVDLT